MDAVASADSKVSQFQVSGGYELHLQSFCEVGKIAHVFGGFDASKIRLLRHIGFDAMVRMSCIDNLDEHFSLWLMRNLNNKTMVLKTARGELLPIKDIDAHFAFGIPFKGKQVIHDNNPDKEVVSSIRRTLFLNDPKASLSLQYLEEILVKDYGGYISEEEGIAFKIAAVLYCMAYFLGVYQPKHCFPI